jgi:ribonuclease VapC
VILDSSALVAILFREPEADAFVDRILAADVIRISVATWVELMMVMAGETDAASVRDAEAFLADAEVQVEPLTLEHGRLARQAFLDFGKGRHPAKLNFGDCFAYALAKATGEPLLFKGDDFAKTDITAA